METEDITCLTMRAVEAVISMGLSPRTAWEEYANVYEPIEVLHRVQGKERLETEIVNEFIAGAASIRPLFGLSGLLYFIKA